MSNPNPWQARQHRAVKSFLRQLERNIESERHRACSEPLLFSDLEEVRQLQIEADSHLLADLKSEYLRGSDAA